MAERPLSSELVRRVDLVLVALVLLVAAGAGGSSLAGVERHAFIQLAAIPLLAWLVLRARPIPWSGATIGILVLLILLALYGLLQTVALPGQDWPEGSPRALVIAAQPLLGLEAAGVGISLAPGETVSAVLALLPPLAIFVAVATARWSQTVEGLGWLVVILGAGSAALGLGQRFAGPEAPLFLYGSAELPPGLFSNPDHQAGFLLMLLPVSLALLLQKRREIGSSDGEIGLFILAAALFLLLVAGIVATGSLTGYAMLAGLIAPCILLSLPVKTGRGPALGIAVMVFALVAGAATTLYAGLNPLPVWGETGATAIRAEVWQQSIAIARDHFPFGAGFGAFEHVYPLYETEGMISSRYMNAAHNEYIQLLVELGLFGVLLAAAGLGLWTYVTVRAWRSKLNDEGRIRRAASMSGLVVILQCMVDYPLHAPLYALVASVFAAVLCLPPRHERQGSHRRQPVSDKRIDL